MTRAAAGARLAAVALLAFACVAAQAARLSIVSGAVGRDIALLRESLDRFEAQTGHVVDIVEMPSSSTDQLAQFRLWLAARNRDVDVYRTDIVWAPQLARHLVDLSRYPAARAAAPAHFPAIIESQTVDGRLVALPYYTDAPALYYRRDLLDRYGLEVPRTWDALEAAARTIQDGERAAGSARMHGYVFQGAAYEGLTCNALEWLVSAGAGTIVEADGRISVANPDAAAAFARAASWIGTIAPPGVLAYREEEVRGVWQTGHAAFMRNWPYAQALSEAPDSAVRGRFGIAPLPSGGAGPAATLGGWNLAVSTYSRSPEAAVDLVVFLTGFAAQKHRAIANNNLPTLPALYDDADLRAARPQIGDWRAIFENAVARPSAPTRSHYNQVSKEFWTAVHATLSGEGDPTRNLDRLAARLQRLRRAGWK